MYTSPPFSTDVRYSLIPYFLIPSFIICDGINSFMQSTMVLSIRSLIQSSLMYRDMRLCER